MFSFSRILIAVVVGLTSVLSFQASAVEIYLSPAGDDSNLGTSTKPLTSLAAAQKLARTFAGKESVTVRLNAGTYYLPATLEFTAADLAIQFNLELTLQIFRRTIAPEQNGKRALTEKIRRLRARPRGPALGRRRQVARARRLLPSGFNPDPVFLKRHGEMLRKTESHELRTRFFSDIYITHDWLRTIAN